MRLAVWLFPCFRPNLRRKYRRVLMDTECTQLVCCCLDGLDTAVHPDVPQLNLAASAAAD